jgi:hypothetical protein
MPARRDSRMAASPRDLGQSTAGFYDALSLELGRRMSKLAKPVVAGRLGEELGLACEYKRGDGREAHASKSHKSIFHAGRLKSLGEALIDGFRPKQRPGKGAARFGRKIRPCKALPPAPFSRATPCTA